MFVPSRSLGSSQRRVRQCSGMSPDRVVRVMRLALVGVYVPGMTRAPVLLLVLVCALSLAGCDWGKTHSEAELEDGLIEIDQAVRPSDLLDGVLGIGRGTPASVVRARLGTPFAKVRSGRGTCWAYRAHQAGTSVDALGFCINKQQRVRRILIGVHL